MSEPSSWSQPAESSHSGVETSGPWDGWDELAPTLHEDELRDAFDPDDLEREPEPEYGDFWLEPGEDGEGVG